MESEIYSRTLPVIHIVLHLLVAEPPANQTLKGENRVCRDHNRLPNGRQTNKVFLMPGKRNNGGRPCTFRVLDDAGHLAFNDGDARIGSSKIDTDNRA